MVISLSIFRYDEALMKYLLLAELGYEVAQSNAAFIMDRKETEMFQSDELSKRALVYWTRYIHDPSIIDNIISVSGLLPRVTVLLGSGWETIIIMAGALMWTTRLRLAITELPPNNKIMLR